MQAMGTLDALSDLVDGLDQSSSMTLETWHQIGLDLARQRQQVDLLGSRQMWAVGDWLVTGEEHVYRHLKRAKVRALAAEATGYSTHTLTMAASVARKVKAAARVDGLSWWHHLAVSGLRKEEQLEWLARAAEGEWSVRELRERMAAAGRVRSRSSTRSQRLVSELVKLRLSELPEPARAELRAWWDRENSTTALS